MPRLRVATYNLYLGADLSLLFDVTDPAQLTARVETVRAQLAATRFEERAVALARVLARERADLVGLQEVARWWAVGPDGREQVLVDFLPTLLAALEDAGCGYDAHAVDSTFSGALDVEGGRMGLVGANAVLARRDGPLRVTAESTGDFAAAHRAVTGIDGVSFPIARGWSRVEAEVDGRSLVFVCTHTEAYDDRARDAQRDELLAAVGGTGGPAVLVGDFNAPPAQVGLPPAYVDAWTAAGGDPAAGFTSGQSPDLGNPVNGLRERIDYVFVSHARVADCRVVGDRQDDRSTPSGLWPSDHAGVVADLDVP